QSVCNYHKIRIFSTLQFFKRVKTHTCHQRIYTSSQQSKHQLTGSINAVSGGCPLHIESPGRRVAGSADVVAARLRRLCSTRVSQDECQYVLVIPQERGSPLSSSNTTSCRPTERELLVEKKR
ncbi:hypothetical protein Tcan_00590, partial [Toxocara canis]